METFKSFPECTDCITNLARTASELSAKGDSGLMEKYHTKALAALDESQGRGYTSPELANRVMRAIRQTSGIEDPYLEFKENEMKNAQSMASDAMDWVNQDLHSLVSFSALGNSLDFFQDASQVLGDVKERMQQGISFYQDQVDKLEAALARKPKQLIFLTDNSGEIFFDLPLVRYLSQKAENMTLVVKGGPALNDLTRKELKKSGLEKYIPHVADTGADGAGVDWEHVSPEFMELLNSSDVVVAKGMANWETIFPRSLSVPVFFLFKVKCKPLRDFLNAPADSYWALWKPAD
ncbi:damage-control phosphatase ARMT1 family protein [Dethiosulfatarculus sandiegensis]|uniref:Damage-control phosphatase ARMT1-like metal-binding domain-containing protein n=1 Tax=Dethiosulfatarculus sandiegensis TaxID=1429043 RepID=A0A0D2JZC2_9BACT|nr:ARMT1-like domain-containing protein [Dethiosulfatarculus sandiegensis]KIX14890.1 hypothetical protein X474_07010 [Dethiosulfatarculus sandiegensis]